MNWRGRPLNSHDIIVNSIKATTTHTGLRVHAELDPGTYETGIKVTDKDIDAPPMYRHRFHGDWNYTLHPQHCDTVGADKGPRPAEGPVLTALRSRSAQFGPDRYDRAALDERVEQVSQGLDELREHGRSQQRGRDRIRARGAGAKTG